MRRLLPPLLSALIAVVLTTASAGPASAHTRLVSSTPAQGAPAQAPREVVLVFSDPVQPSLSAVSVTGRDGEEHASGTPAPRSDGASVGQALRAPLEPGTYRVAYRVLAADGHPVTGSFELTAVARAPATAPAPTPPAPTSTTTPAVQPVSAGRDEDGGPPALALLAGGLVVAGGAGLLARRFAGPPPSA